MSTERVGWKAVRLGSNQLQAIGTMAAALAALIALFVAWDQGRTMRAQQHASVWPAIQITPAVGGESGDTYASVRVENSGVGPAIIHSVEVFAGGEPVASHNQLVEIMPPNAKRGETDLGGVVLAPSKELTFYRYAWPNDEIDLADILRVQNSIEVRICYCSVMGRCWERRSVAETPPEEISACPVNQFR